MQASQCLHCMSSHHSLKTNTLKSHFDLFSSYRQVFVNSVLRLQRGNWISHSYKVHVQFCDPFLKVMILSFQVKSCANNVYSWSVIKVCTICHSDSIFK